jgi:homopolymeric O-antigen transport system permease protein
MSVNSQTASLVDLAKLYLRHRQLTWEMIKRDITDRYAGQIFGSTWAIGHPFILMAIYTFVFTFIFSSRMGSQADFPLDYTTYLLSGLIPWMSFQESMTRGTTAILSNANLVKQVVFPLEILPVKGIFSSLLTQGVATLFLMTYVVVIYGRLPWTYSLLPLLILFQFLAMTGVCYILSSVGPYFRDLKDIVQVICIACLYGMPVFYLPNWVPGWFKPIFYLNPFSYMVWCFQDVCYFGRFEHPFAWPIFFSLSILSLVFGNRVFGKLKTMFGNIL